MDGSGVQPYSVGLKERFRARIKKLLLPTKYQFFTSLIGHVYWLRIPQCWSVDLNLKQGRSLGSGTDHRFSREICLAYRISQVGNPTQSTCLTRKEL